MGHMCRSFHFPFLVTFDDEYTKILRNLCLHFVRQDGQDGKNWNENQSDQNTKNHMAKIWNERNIW